MTGLCRSQWWICTNAFLMLWPRQHNYELCGHGGGDLGKKEEVSTEPFSSHPVYFFIFTFNQEDRNNLISISQTHTIQIRHIFNFTFKGLRRAHSFHIVFRNQDIIYTESLGFRVEDGYLRLQCRPYVASPNPGCSLSYSFRKVDVHQPQDQ